MGEIVQEMFHFLSLKALADLDRVITGLVSTIGITRGLLVLTELEVESGSRFLLLGIPTGFEGGVLTALDGRGLRDIEDLEITLSFRLAAFFTLDFESLFFTASSLTVKNWGFGASFKVLRMASEAGLRYNLGVGGGLERSNFRLGVAGGLESLGVVLELLISSEDKGTVDGVDIEDELTSDWLSA